MAGALAAAGVRTVFSLSGNQIMPIFDACIDAGIRIVHVRHEAAAVAMADAWAQLGGGVGVALVTAGPGFANAMSPLYAARAAESPVVLLSGDAPVGQDGLGAFQELDQAAVAAPVAKLAFRARRAAGLGVDVARAVRAARSGRPGPVHLALPFDLLNEAVEAAVPSAAAYQRVPAHPDPAAVAAIRDALAAAERPLVVVGPAQNPTRSAGLTARLAEAADVPVVSMESPRGLRDPGLGAFPDALAEADLIVSLGKAVDFSLGFGRAVAATARAMVVDPDPVALDRAHRAFGPRLALAAAGDADLAAAALAASATSTGRSAWRERVAALVALRPEVVAPPSGRMHPAVACAAVQRVLDAAADPVLIVDGGEFGQWAWASLAAPTRIVNGPSGAIGNGLCYAISAALARPGATVVAMMGDGTVGFHLAELETAGRSGARMLAVVGHDARWNAEHQIQLRDYGPNRLIGCELSPARYDAAAVALGCHGGHVDDPAALDAALAAALASGLPACVTVAIEGVPAPSGH